MNNFIILPDLDSAMHKLSVETLIRLGIDYLAQIISLPIQIQYLEIHISFPATQTPNSNVINKELSTCRANVQIYSTNTHYLSGVNKY